MRKELIVYKLAHVLRRCGLHKQDKKKYGEYGITRYIDETGESEFPVQWHFPAGDADAYSVHLLMKVKDGKLRIVQLTKTYGKWECVTSATIRDRRYFHYYGNSKTVRDHSYFAAEYLPDLLLAKGNPVDNGVRCADFMWMLSHIDREAVKKALDLSDTSESPVCRARNMMSNALCFHLFGLSSRAVSRFMPQPGESRNKLLRVPIRDRVAQLPWRSLRRAVLALPDYAAIGVLPVLPYNTLTPEQNVFVVQKGLHNVTLANLEVLFQPACRRILQAIKNMTEEQDALAAPFFIRDTITMARAMLERDPTYEIPRGNLRDIHDQLQRDLRTSALRTDPNLRKPILRANWQEEFKSKWDNAELTIGDDVYKLYVPTTRHELLTIGDAMSICVGNAEYTASVVAGNSIIVAGQCNGRWDLCAAIHRYTDPNYVLQVSQAVTSYNKTSPELYHAIGSKLGITTVFGDNQVW